jgi:hypothetical protein
MTVGELARRTGVSRKAIRDLEGLGLIYSAGRNDANYRLIASGNEAEAATKSRELIEAVARFTKSR